MLVNSGWEYEKGLGAEGQGARHPVATRLKHDRLALGAAGTSKKLVTHTFEEIEKSRAKPIAKVCMFNGPIFGHCWMCDTRSCCRSSVTFV